MVLSMQPQPPLRQTTQNALRRPPSSSTDLGLTYIPAGDFMMGVLPSGDDPYKWAAPRHRVQISNSFYMIKYHITQRIWKEMMGNNPSQSQNDDYPVMNITWFQAVEFCNKLSQKKEGNQRIRLRINPSHVIGNQMDFDYQRNLNGNMLPEVVKSISMRDQMIWMRSLGLMIILRASFIRSVRRCQMVLVYMICLEMHVIGFGILEWIRSIKIVRQV